MVDPDSSSSEARTTETLQQQPVAWRREWDGDVSDEGLWLYTEDESETDDGHEWQPLYLKPPTLEECRESYAWFKQVVAEAKRQKIESGDKLLIGNFLRRVEAARRFPDNTDPCSRHVQIMGETLGAGLPYPMLDEERGHCAISLLAVVAALYEARNALEAAGLPTRPNSALRGIE